MLCRSRALATAVLVSVFVVGPACSSDTGDAGGSDGVAADALTDGSAAPTECIANKRFCWQGQTWEVWSCNAKGEPTVVHKTCSADETCAVVAGVATCAAPTDAGGTSGGSGDTGSGADVGGEDAAAADAAAADTGAADVGAADAGAADAGAADATAPDASDAASSDATPSDAAPNDAGNQPPTTCVKNKSFCWDGDVWMCNVKGEPIGKSATCKDGKVCAVVSGVALCATPKPDAGPTDVGAADSGTVDAGPPDTGISDTGISDAGTTDSGTTDASGPTSCPPNKSFCYGDEIWLCNVKGEPIAKSKTCTGGTTCVVKSGVPQCAAPVTDAGATDTGVADAGSADVGTADTGGPSSCPANKNFCYGDEIWTCNVKGEPIAKTKTCTGGTTCVVKFGVPQCAAPVTDAGPTDAGSSDTSATDAGTSDTSNSTCTPNKNYCYGGDVWGCNAAGTPTGKKTSCGAGTTCGVQAGVATCVQDPVDAGPTDTGATDAGTTDAGTSDSGTTDTGAPKTCTKGKTFCDGTTVRYCKSDGTWGSVKTQCKSGFVCGIEGGAAVCIAGKMDCSASPCTCVPTVPDACVATTDSSVSFGKVYSTKKKTDCYQPATLQACPKGNSCVAGVCTSSVVDPKAPYYNDSCDLEKHLAAKTNLAADCRCFYNQGIKDGVPVCYRPFDAFKAGKTVSTGPSVGGLPTVSIAGGTYDAKADELIWAVSWGSSTARKGLLLGVDVKTGKRRVLSGAYQGSGASATTGSGPALTWPTEVRFGPDGKLYVLNNTAAAKPEVIAVDPATGNRTLRWRGGDKAFGQCASPTAGKSVQYTSGGFAVDSDGSMLIGFANPVSDGRGIARVSADAKGCAVVTAVGSAGGKIDKGTGGKLGGFVQGFATHGGKIQALTTQPKTLWEIDPKTGNRTALVGGGTGTSLGERHVSWDAKRKLFWIAGIKDSVTVYAFDPVTKKLTHAQKTCGGSSFVKVCWAGPININTLNYGGMVVHPSNGRLYFGQDTMAIVEVEPESGNSVLLSL